MKRKDLEVYSSVLNIQMIELMRSYLISFDLLEAIEAR